MNNTIDTNADVAPEADNLASRIEKEVAHTTDTEKHSVKYALDQAPMGVCINLVGAVLFIAWQWKNIPEYIMIPWFFFITCNTLVHLHIINQQKKFVLNSNIQNNWAFYNGFVFCIYSLSWGIGYNFFFPYLDGSEQLFLYYIVAIYFLSHIPVLASTFNAYACLVVAQAIPVSFLIFQNEWPKSALIFSLLAGTCVTFFLLARKYQKIITESYRLAVELKINAEDSYNKKLNDFNLHFRKETERYQTETKKLLNEKEYAFKTLRCMGEAILTTDSIGKVNYVNPIAEVYLGWDKDVILGKHIDMIFNIYDESSKIKIPCPFDKCINTSGNINSNNKTKLIRKDKIEYSIEYCISPIFDKSSKITGTVLIFRDVTEKRTEEKNLSWQASHDQLTGLINRREFENRLNRILRAKDTHRQHALCYLDLDHFKIVNDCCGHLAGDKLLIKISERLKNKTRDTDTLARLGGDEFGLIFYSCSLERANLLAEIVRKEIESLDFEWNNKTYKVSASIGVIAINEQFNDLSEVLRAADIACYDAKANGRNKVNLLDANTEVIQNNRNMTGFIETVQECLQRESFLLYQQSIMTLDEYSDSSVCEILIRAKQQSGDVLKPEQFLPVAKQYNLMPNIDRWVIKACFELISYKHPSLKNFSVYCINLSEQSITDGELIKYVTDTARDYSVEPSTICLEIPETSLIHHPEQTIKLISKLKDADFKISLDDFHSGLESFKILKDMKLDYIKFDGRAENSGKSKNIEYKILESMNNISHHMGCQTIAKYIDNQANMDLLYEIGIDYAQGFQFAKPLQLSKDIVNSD